MDLAELVKEAEDNLTATRLEREALLKKYMTLTRIEQNTEQYLTIELIKRAKLFISDEVTQCENVITIQRDYLSSLNELYDDKQFAEVPNNE